MLPAGLLPATTIATTIAGRPDLGVRVLLAPLCCIGPPIAILPALKPQAFWPPHAHERGRSSSARWPSASGRFHDPLLPESIPRVLLLKSMTKSGQVLSSSHPLPKSYHYSMFDVKLVLMTSRSSM